jgi:hypothetical protein
MITTTAHGRKEEQRRDLVEKERWSVISHRLVLVVTKIAEHNFRFLFNHARVE